MLRPHTHSDDRRTVLCRHRNLQCPRKHFRCDSWDVLRLKRPSVVPRHQAARLSMVLTVARVWEDRGVHGRVGRVGRSGRSVLASRVPSAHTDPLLPRLLRREATATIHASLSYHLDFGADAAGAETAAGATNLVFVCALRLLLTQSLVVIRHVLLAPSLNPRVLAGPWARRWTAEPT